jgi:hypothetical protein
MVYRFMKGSVYCRVRAESLKIIPVNCFFKRSTQSAAKDAHHALTAKQQTNTCNKLTPHLSYP